MTLFMAASMLPLVLTPPFKLKDLTYRVLFILRQKVVIS
jgi:hypothetical protein